jgi:hypothetical protein
MAEAGGGRAIPEAKDVGTKRTDDSAKDALPANGSRAGGGIPSSNVQGQTNIQEAPQVPSQNSDTADSLVAGSSEQSGGGISPHQSLRLRWGPSGKQKQVSSGDQSILPLDLPLKFLLNNGTREKYTFDSPTRTWNGNLWGKRKIDGGPDLRSPSNYSSWLRPQVGEETTAENGQTIIWNGCCWRLLESASGPSPDPEKEVQLVKAIVTRNKWKKEEPMFEPIFWTTEKKNDPKNPAAKTTESVFINDSRQLKTMIHQLFCDKIFPRLPKDDWLASGGGVGGGGGGGVLNKGKKKEVVCHEFHHQFRSELSLDEKVAKRYPQPRDWPETPTPYCLWTALYEAMVDAGVPEMSKDSDQSKNSDKCDSVTDYKKVRERCLGYMLLSENQRQQNALGKSPKEVNKEKRPELFFKDEFVESTFKLSGPSEPLTISKFYEVGLLGL